VRTVVGPPLTLIVIPGQPVDCSQLGSWLCWKGSASRGGVLADRAGIPTAWGRQGIQPRHRRRVPASPEHPAHHPGKGPGRRNSFSGKLVFHSYDHFGLDPGDEITEYGFIGWFTFQRYDRFDGKYPPPIAQVDIEIPISGTF
jgi:hypothetical protein